MNTLSKIAFSALLASTAAFAVVATPTAYNSNAVTASYAKPEAGSVVADFRAPESNNNAVTADYNAPESNNNSVVASYAKPEAGFVVADIPGTDHTPSAG